MINLAGEVFVYVDIDDTLVMWNAAQEDLDARGVDITYPGSALIDEKTGQIVYGPSLTARVLPHRKHIDSLKKHKLRGHTIIAWSSGGASWAYAACKALGLSNVVDLATGKSHYYYDDLDDPSKILGRRYYFKGQE